ncbi:hypothetical protein Tco_1020890 [Tanacetum coccineum]
MDGWGGLPEFVDYVTDYCRHAPSIDVYKRCKCERRLYEKNVRSQRPRGIKGTGIIISHNKLGKCCDDQKKACLLLVEQLKEGESSLFNKNNSPQSKKKYDSTSYFDEGGKCQIDEYLTFVQLDAPTLREDEHDQEFDAEITTVGAEVDDIAAET